MSKKQIIGQMPNGNIVKYDTQQAPETLEKKKPGRKNKTLAIASHLTGAGLNSVKTSPQESKSLLAQYNDFIEAAAEALTPEDLESLKAPAKETLPPPEGETKTVLTPEDKANQKRIQEATTLFNTLTKSGHSPRNARRFVLKKLKVRIFPNL